MRWYFLSLLAVLASHFSLLGQGHILTPSEFEIALGDQWTGDLVYWDDESAEEVSIPVQLQIYKVTDREYKFQYTYPEEQKANHKERVKIGKNHMTLNKGKIIDRKKLSDGTLTFRTKHNGKDNKKAAIIFQDYHLSDQELVISRSIQYEGSDEVRLQNTYKLSR